VGNIQTEISAISIPVEVGPGETFEQHINIALLDQQVRAELDPADLDLPRRVWGVTPLKAEDENGKPEYAVGVSFVSPPSPEEVSQVEAVVAAHDPAGRTQEQRDAIQKGADFDDLRANVAAVLADAASALAQIDADFTALAADIAALNAATTLAQARPSILDSMQVLTRTLNRQRRIIQSLVYAVRAIRWFVGNG
jgi:hypothetical protein